MSDRTLPHDLDAERALLGAVLVAPTGWAQCASRVKADQFFRDAHRRLFAAMTRLAERGVGVDLVTLGAELISTGEIDEVGGPAYVSALLDGVPRSSNVLHYAEIVREKARLRALISGANETLGAAYLGEQTASEIASAGMNRLARATVGSAAEAPTMAEAINQYFGEVIGGLAPPVPSGYDDLDELLGGGLVSQDLVIVAARPSAGKTSFTLGIADYMARHGHACVFFSLEMAQRPLSGRLLSWASRVPARTLEQARASQAQYDQTNDAFAALGEPPLWLHTTARTVTEMWAWCRRRKAEGGLTCAIVDYLQLLLPETRARSRQEEVADISRNLKAMAKDLDIVLIALSQLSRAPEGRSDKRPHVSDLRDSGAIEQDADVAILLFRPDMHGKADDERTNEAEVIVAKQRNGPTGVVKMVFNSALSQFETRAARGPE